MSNINALLVFQRVPALRMLSALKMLCMAAVSLNKGMLRAPILAAVIAATTIGSGASQTLPERAKPAQVRLLGAGRDDATGHYRAVVEIALAPGYKTYWRDPGDSGVPTVFEWVTSDNVSAAHTRFPAPTRFFDGSGYAIGYLQTARFPVEVTPKDAGQPIVLRLTASFGVCRELCIPEQAEAEITLSDIEDIAGLWDETIARVPAIAKPGESVVGLEVKHARLTTSQLELLVAGLTGAERDVFVEAPVGWQFGQPKQTAQADAMLFTFPVEANKPISTSIAFTIIVKGEAHAIEVPLMLSQDGD